MAVTPRGARQILALAQKADVSDVLPTITCPTLVLHHRENQFVPIELGRAVADAIPGARFVAVEGIDSMAWFGDAEALLGEIEEFLTGSRTPGRRSQLVAILFTDIVGSTALATRLHHEQWQRLLNEHDQLVRPAIERAGGTVIKAVGDGFLATFNTPDRALRAADQALRSTEPLGLRLRAGIHVGVVEKLPHDVRGLAVHIAARISEYAAPGQVLVSETVKDILVDSDLALRPVREEQVRGVPGRWTLYELCGDGAAEAEIPAAEAGSPRPARVHHGHHPEPAPRRPRRSRLT